MAILPIIGMIALILWISSGSPILFRQKRVGIGGHIFTMLKFRTMIVNASALQKNYAKLNEARGPVFKIHDDPRFTPFGRFLAHTGLDELPQLVNVLVGDMNLIGPRPLPVREASKLKPWQKKRHIIKPGIISPWIFQGYHNTSFDSWMKSDIAYIQNKSFAKDAQLFIKACATLVRFTSVALIE